MELRHLRYFVAVAEELHFGRAARRVHMAQPPLSQQIRVFEGELGVKLFHRTSRRVELTGEGRTLLSHARLVLAQADRAIQAVQAAARGDTGRLAVGFVTSAMYAQVPAILREFHHRHPRAELGCFEMRLVRQVEALRQREIDVGFVRVPVREPGIASVLLSKEPLVLVLPAEHPRASVRRARLSDFGAETFITVSRAGAPAFHDVLMEACRQAGFVPRVEHEVGEVQTVLALVAAGLGVALVPASLRHMARPGAVYIDLGPRTGEVPLELIWRKESPQPLVDAFIAAARAVTELPPG